MKAFYVLGTILTTGVIIHTTYEIMPPKIVTKTEYIYVPTVVPSPEPVIEKPIVSRPSGKPKRRPLHTKKKEEPKPCNALICFIK